jgi:uncharacterized oxidoreductase
MSEPAILRQPVVEELKSCVESSCDYLQTELTGSRQASDPRAMPLNDFIAESIQILQSQPEIAEVLVENVKPQRFAAESGTEGYNALVKGFNDAVAKMMSA